MLVGWIEVFKLVGVRVMRELSGYEPSGREFDKSTNTADHFA